MMRLRRNVKAFAGCVERPCRPYMPHGRCQLCDEITCSKTVGVARGSLRRVRVFVCEGCIMSGKWTRGQASLRAQRTEKDWSQLTEPIDPSHLVSEMMPEQYAGATRATLRAFIDSGDTKAVVNKINPQTLNASLVTLGLINEVYAEQRDTTTVLRRIIRT